MIAAMISKTLLKFNAEKLTEKMLVIPLAIFDRFLNVLIADNTVFAILLNAASAPQIYD